VIKKCAVVAVLLIVAAATFGCGGEDLPKDAAAKVGETVITTAQVDARVAEIQAQLPGQTPDPETDEEGYKDFRARLHGHFGGTGAEVDGAWGHGHR